MFVITVEKLPLTKMQDNRDENGRFTESSDLDKKSLGVRLYAKDRDRLQKVSKERGVKTGVLVREIINNWLNELETNEEIFSNPITV